MKPMTFHDWLYSVYPENAAINGQWGVLHIVTLFLCIALCVGLYASFHKKDQKTGQRVILVLAMVILAFELTRRVINLSRGCVTFTDYARTLLPRPWCAISCWTLILAVFVRRAWLYNFAAMTALLNALVFFAYPSVGFNHRVILFENLYSICTHALLLVSAITLMSLGLTDFQLKKRMLLKQGGMVLLTYVYAFAEIFLLKIEADPLFFMNGNEVQTILGVSYPLYLVIYAVFLCVYFSAFFAVQHLLDQKRGISQ
jgi:hypothetical protein